MNFTLPEMVSQGLRDKDKILVEMLPKIFIEELEFRPGSKVKTKSEDYSFEHDLEKQVGPETDEMMAVIEGMMNGFFGSCLFLGFLLSSDMQLLWMLMNTLQMIVITALFNVSMPYNAYGVLI